MSKKQVLLMEILTELPYSYTLWDVAAYIVLSLLILGACVHVMMKQMKSQMLS
jgi:hypothetical protein